MEVIPNGSQIVFHHHHEMPRLTHPPICLRHLQITNPALKFPSTIINQPATIVERSRFSWSNGPTIVEHLTSHMACLPNILIMAPSDEAELINMGIRVFTKHTMWTKFYGIVEMVYGP